VDGGWGVGDGGLGIGDWAQSPIPNPQSPIPNPQIYLYFIFFIKIIINKIKNKLFFYNNKNKKAELNII